MGTGTCAEKDISIFEILKSMSIQSIKNISISYRIIYRTGGTLSQIGSAEYYILVVSFAVLLVGSC